MAIRRILLATLTTCVMAAPARAQGIGGFYGGGFLWRLPSVSMTGGEVQYARPVWDTGTPTTSTASRTFGQAASGDQPVPDLVIAAVGAGGFAKADDDTAFNLAGGIRLGHIIDRQWGLYGDVLLGIVRFPGSTNFTLRPGAGVIRPIPNKPFSVVLGAVFPSIFFSPFRETGYGFQGGLLFQLN